MRRVNPLVVVLVAGAALVACSTSTTTSRTSASKPKEAVVDGVPLVPITPVQRTRCVAFADRLKRQVPCPGLLPKPIPVSPASPAASCLEVSGEGACGPAKIQVDPIFLLSQSNFQVPPGYVGVTFEQYGGTVAPERSVEGGALGHFVFTAGGLPIPSYCSPQKSAKSLRVKGAVAKLYKCSDSATGPDQLLLIEGHELLVWRAAGITTEVSFHGHSQVNADLDIAVAKVTVLVQPSKR